MRVLMTGYDGYVGAVMVPVLTAAGHELVGLDNHYFSGCDFGRYRPDIKTIRADIRDLEPSHLDGIDAVVHLAAVSNDPLGNLNPQSTYDINHKASMQLAKLARDAKVSRFIYSSSCSIYGAASQRDVLDETASFSPVTPYAKSKVMVESDLEAMGDDEFCPVFMRNATVYGASPKLRGDLVVNNLTGWALTTGKVFMKSDGTPWRPLLHVRDMAEAFLAVLEAPRASVFNQAFNVGHDGENYRISQVAEIVKSQVSDSVIEYSEGAGADPRCYRVTFDKLARTLPELKLTWNVEKGVAELIKAYRTEGLTQEQLEGGKFLRIKTISQHIESGRLSEELRWKSSS